MQTFSSFWGNVVFDCTDVLYFIQPFSLIDILVFSNDLLLEIMPQYRTCYFIFLPLYVWDCWVKVYIHMFNILLQNWKVPSYMYLCHTNVLFVLVALTFINKEWQIVLNILGHCISKTHLAMSISSSFVLYFQVLFHEHSCASVSGAHLQK